MMDCVDGVYDRIATYSARQEWKRKRGVFRLSFWSVTASVCASLHPKTRKKTLGLLRRLFQ